MVDKTLKITLVYPSPTRHTAPPLGIAYLAAVLREKNKEVSIIDFNEIENEHDFIRKFNKINPDVIGFSVQTNFFDLSLDYAKLVKKLNPNIITLFGGPHSSVMPKETLENEAIDIIIIGEAEVSFVNLIDALEKDKDLSTVMGIGFKKGKKIKINERQQYIQNLDEIPFPARDLLPMDDYLRNIPAPPLRMKMTHIMTNRGCPFNCTFCQPTSDTMWGKKVRYRSPKNVCDEIEFLQERYNIDFLGMGADTFTLNKQWVHDMCDEIKRRKIDIAWMCAARVGTIDYETLKKIKSAGCEVINAGVESGSPKILKNINKGITLPQITDYFKWSHELRLLTIANFMIGNIGENLETIEESNKLIKIIKPDYINICVANPIPGTYLYETALKEDLINFEDYSTVDRHTIGNLKVKDLTEEQIKVARECMFDNYFKIKLKRLVNPAEYHFHVALMKRLWSLRYSRLNSFKKSYNMLRSPEEKPLNKIKEMIIKGI